MREDILTTEEMVALCDEESLLKDPVDIPLPLGDDDDLEEEKMSEDRKWTRELEES